MDCTKERHSKSPAQQGFHQHTVLVADDEPDTRWALKTLLEDKGYQFVGAENGREALQKAGGQMPDLVLLDIRMPGLDGLQTLKRIKEIDPEVTVVMITAYGKIEDAVQCIKRGAYEFLTKPYDNEYLLGIVKEALEQREQAQRPQWEQDESGETLVEKMGPSQTNKRLVERVNQVAPSDLSILIQGESGSGKELVAREIHRKSHRSSRPLVAIDCGAVPESLTESELFGYERGAFTGASKRKKGAFEAAQNGTLFLDEVVNLSVSQQKTLLRALQEKSIIRVGDARSFSVNLRVVSTSNKVLLDQVEAGDFRQDLYYRINQFKIEVPPLRERREDIMYLADRFLTAMTQELEKQVSGFSEGARDLLMRYEWPGNVRELKNVIYSATVFANSQIIPEYFPEELQRFEKENGSINSVRAQLNKGHSWHEMKARRVEEFERQVINEALRETRGNISAAARLLDINYKTLHTKIKHLDLLLPGK